MSDIEAVIHFWKEKLHHDRTFMDTSLIYQIEQTILHLETLKLIKGKQ